MNKQVWTTTAAGLLAFGAMVGCQSADTLSPVPDGEASTTAFGDAVSIAPGLGSVFTATNSSSGNEIIQYARTMDGSIAEVARVSTGGVGTGGGLGNQSGISLSPNGQWLFAVNAGSDDVSVFRVRRGQLELMDTEPSGGTQPISVTAHGSVVYVLNAGVPNNIQGFQLSSSGDLMPIAGSERMLSGDDVGPAQVSFSPNGDYLVVTEKGTNSITTYTVGNDGQASMPNVQASNGMTPFGFSFSDQGILYVSEAFGGADNASAVSSYEIHAGGDLSVVDGSVATDQTAACWLIVTRNGRYAYTTNTGSGSLTGYRVHPSGDLDRLDKDGRTGDAGEGSRPIDVAQSRSGKYLYVLEGGTHTLGIFEVGNDGSLESLGEISGLPDGTNGMAAL